ncbi:MAG: hypothetical protein ACFFCS_22865 [Candidatus Hodarchaeota archaeon]
MREGKKSWQWHYEEDHWMDVYLNDNGLSYYGTDYTCVSGGGYTGGFQTIKEFMENGGICDMPSEIENEIREFIQKSVPDLPNVKVIIENKAQPYNIFRIFAGMEDAATKFLGEKDDLNASPRICHFDGGMQPGTYSYGFAIQLMDEKGKVSHDNTVRGDVNFKLEKQDIEILIRIELNNGRLEWKSDVNKGKPASDK